MKGIVSVLEELEKLIYKVLLWLILIPKTLFQVFVHPIHWAPNYIREELGEGKSRFDEYLSPVVLLFVVALLPSVVWNFLPVYGVELNSPAIDQPSPNRSLDFDAKIRFISSVDGSNGFITTYWRVEKEAAGDQGYSYPIVKSARYTNNPEDANSPDYFYFVPLDNNTIQDYYSDVNFTEPGGYWVVVDAYKFDQEHVLLETYTNEIYIYVPENSNENVYISSDRQSGKEDDKPLLEKVSGKFKSEETYFLALGLLIPPLLFALATKLVGKEPISEDVLRETFYIQCYYFAPLGFVFWASTYALYFFTPEMFNYYNLGAILITALPILLAVFWFISVETHIIAEQRQISGWKSFGIVIGCIVTLLVGVWFIVNGNTPQVQEGTRKLTIWMYPIVSIGLLTAYHWMVVRRTKESETEKVSTGDKALAIATVVVIGLSFLAILIGSRTTEDSIDVNATQQARVSDSIPTLTQIVAFQQQTAQAPQATESSFGLESTSTPEPIIEDSPTPAPEQPVEATATSEQPTTQDNTPQVIVDSATPTSTPAEQKYFTDEFDGDMNAWPYFLTRGDESVFKYNLDGGKLYVQLLQLDEKKPWVYFINNLYTYTDVQVETFTTNSGVNSNGVSLICRFSDAGWYEFMVSNSGLYTIYAYDASNRVYGVIATGGSPAIKTGLSPNTYTAVCRGNELTLIVNDRLVTTVQETQFNFTEGRVGIGISSPEGLPVNVDFEYVKVSEPQ